MSFNDMDKRDEKILLCLLRHIDIPTDSDRKKIKALQKGKVSYSQVEINSCLIISYWRAFSALCRQSCENTFYSNACSKIVLTQRGKEHIEYLWPASQYNRKWFETMCQFSWSKFWAIALSCFLTAVFSQILRSCEK